MLMWLGQNLSTMIISIILLLIVAGIVFYMIKSKRQGKSSCGCNCQSCPMGGACNNKK